MMWVKGLRGSARTLRLVALSVVAFVALGVVAVVPALAQEEPATAFASSDPNPEAPVVNGWDAAHTHYYANGQPVSGAYEIEGVWRVFDKTGKLMTETCTLGSITYFPNRKGVLRARKVSGVWRYADGRGMTAGDVKDIECLLYAEKVAARITEPTDTLEEKRLKCFEYIVLEKTFKSPMRKWREYKDAGWQADYAMDQLAGEYGDCMSSATAFGYLCAAIGYDDVVLCTATKRYEPHCWIMLDGLIFDPQQARKFGNDLDRFYNADPDTNYWRASKKTFTQLLKRRFSIPQFDPSHILRGLKYENGAYFYYKDNERQRSVWKTVKGKRYYFKSDGKASVGSTKVGKTYYVFSTKGVLQRGSKTRVVKVGSKYYRVTKSGKAHPGRTKGNANLYLKNGERAAGSCKIGKRYYVFSSKGQLLRGKRTRTVKVSGVYYQVRKDGIAKSGWNKSRTRYFTSNGKQVKGLRKVGKTYYVFNERGVLKRGKRTRTVKVSGNRYLVSKAGKAKTGWSSSHKYLFAGHGTQVKGSCFVKGKLYYLSADGVYSKDKTAALRKLAAKDANAASLLELLGKPVKKTQAESCLGYKDRDGDDVMYTFAHLRVQTFLVTQPGVEETGREYVMAVMPR